MPTYPYECEPCHKTWDVIKSMSEYDSPEPCAVCKRPATRRLAIPNIDKTAAGTWNTQSWHPALGCYTRSDQHAQKIAKARGLEAVGTEAPEKIHKHFEKQREDTRERRWAEADREKQYGD